MTSKPACVASPGPELVTYCGGTTSPEVYIGIVQAGLPTAPVPPCQSCMRVARREKAAA